MASQLIGIARLAASAPTLEQKRLTEYRQLTAYTLLNRCSSPRMPFEWTINPYRGCEIGCKYCYARYTHEFMELRDPVDFETKIFAKAWNRADFRAQMRKFNPRDRVAIGTATDPYQPAERRYRLTRSILEVLATFSHRQFSLTTKSDLVLRDLDLLARIGSRNKLLVNLTITTLDPDLARKTEPRAARPDLRLDTVHRLAEAGVAAGILCSPLMPRINDGDEQLDALARAAAEAGAKWLVGFPLYLKPASRAIFFAFLDEHFPHLAPRYRARFEECIYLRGPYVDKMKNRFAALRQEYGLGLPEIAHAPDDPQLQLPF